MRMRAHIHTPAGCKINRAKKIEKDEWPNTAALNIGQIARDKKFVAQVVGFAFKEDHGGGPYIGPPPTSLYQAAQSAFFMAPMFRATPDSRRLFMLDRTR